ncbi:MAG: ThiF family adenylyltransferase [Planctomycetales bacterium]|nr:ThiF family adenylyltransferase [Planctomycetales bacterium]
MPSRYTKQIRFAPLGEAGQRRLTESRALVIGCGALGSVIASTLVRAGVGFVRVADRDYLELSNLQRQVLYDEQDVASGLPKAVVAAQKLRQINSEVTVEEHVVDVTHENIDRLASDVHVLVDGLDNFETRLLVNDYAVKQRIPWVYGGCVGAEGQVLAILPGETPCLRGLVPEPPPPGVAPTCDSAGVIGPAVNVVASLQSVEALKILSGNPAAVNRQLTSIDLWNNRIRQLAVDKLHPVGDCPACDHGEFPWLSGERASRTAVLCGRNAVQIRTTSAQPIDLAGLAAQLDGEVLANPFLVKLMLPDYELTLFRDGRVIVVGTDQEAKARSLVAQHLGM